MNAPASERPNPYAAPAPTIEHTPRGALSWRLVKSTIAITEVLVGSFLVLGGLIVFAAVVRVHGSWSEYLWSVFVVLGGAACMLIPGFTLTGKQPWRYRLQVLPPSYVGLFALIRFLSG